MCRFTKRLHNNIDGAQSRVRSLNRERNALAFFVDTNDEELSGLLLSRDPWSFNHEPLDTGGNELRMNDLEHVAPRTDSSAFILSGQCTSIYDAHHIATKRQSQSGEWAKAVILREKTGWTNPP